MPKIGVTYLFSPTLTASVSAGPPVRRHERNDERQRVLARVLARGPQAGLQLRLRGRGLSGTSETDTFAGSFFVNQWIRPYCPGH